MTYHEICQRYNESVQKVDRYLNRVYSEYAESVESGLYGGYYIEAEVESSSKKARKGLIQAFKEFVQNLCEKVKNFVTKKKLSQVEKIVAKDPSLAQYVIDDVTDPNIVKSIILEREKLCQKIVAEYARKGEEIDLDKIDDMVTKEQIASREKLIKSRKKSKIAHVIGAIAGYLGTLGNLACYTGTTNALDKIDAGEMLATTDRANKLDRMRTASSFGFVGTVAVGVANHRKSVNIQKTINNLMKENKLLLSDEIQKLTRECTARVAQPYMKKDDEEELVTSDI